MHASKTIDLAPDDPLSAYLRDNPGPIDVAQLALNSPLLQALREAGVKLVAPLVSQGELIGLLNLGPRRNGRAYSADEYKLLNDLAGQAAPALRVAQLARQHQLEAEEQERLDQEMQVARLIQQTLLPKEPPTLPGWEVAVHWQPAQAIGGDFYDFLSLPDGRLALIIADVTHRGVPAALVMATTRATLRGATRRLLSPGAALTRSNNLLCPDMPENMFVTCLYAILDPASGRLQYANAGHNPPYWQRHGEVVEMEATGIPLGLIPEADYEENEIVLTPGESVLFYSNGLVEAYNPQHEMFSFTRLRDLVKNQADQAGLIDVLLAELARFTGPRWRQEDDLTLMSLRRIETTAPCLPAPGQEVKEGSDWRILAEFSLPSAPGNERLAAEQVVEVIKTLNLPPLRQEGLKTAVAEATMNAMEHGNSYQAQIPTSVQVLISAGATVLAVRITDQGHSRPIPPPQVPNLAAKLAGRQTPRGWGLFLIEQLVDETRVITNDHQHTVELIMYLK